MCTVHNAMFRGFNSMYQQAPHVQDADKAAFVGYCQTWVKFLHSHTQHEETGMFLMAEELLQEKVFDDMHEGHGKCTPRSVLCPLAKKHIVLILLTSALL